MPAFSLFTDIAPSPTAIELPSALLARQALAARTTHRVTARLVLQLCSLGKKCRSGLPVEKREHWPSALVQPTLSPNVRESQLQLLSQISALFGMEGGAGCSALQVGRMGTACPSDMHEVPCKHRNTRTRVWACWLSHAALLMGMIFFVQQASFVAAGSSPQTDAPLDHPSLPTTTTSACVSGNEVCTLPCQE